MKRSGILNSLFSVSAVLLVVKFLGFIKQMVIASTFGATLETDLISLSYGFVAGAKELLSYVFLTALVSVYISVKNQNPEEAGVFAWDTLKVSSLIAGGVIILILIFASPIAHILAPSYQLEEIQQLIFYLRLFAPILLLFIWMGVGHGLLNANQRFLPGQMEGIYQSVILIVLSFLLAPTLEENTLSLGYWVYAIVAGLILLAQARHYFTPICSNPFLNPNIRLLLRMMGPLSLGYGAVYINQIVDKMLVSGLEPGSVTALSYASVLTSLVGTLIGSLCTVLYPHMTELISKGNDQSVVSLTERSAQILTVSLLPVTIITVCLTEDLVTLIYGRGAFVQREIELVAMALAGYGFSFIPRAWRDVYSRLQYGYQNSKGPSRSSVIGIAGNIVLSILLCPILGIFGVTIASSVSMLLIGVLNMIFARSNSPGLSFGWLWRSLPFLCIGGVVSILLCLKGQQWFATMSVLVRLCLITGIVFLTYILIILPLLWKLGLKGLVQQKFS